MIFEFDFDQGGPFHNASRKSKWEKQLRVHPWCQHCEGWKFRVNIRMAHLVWTKTVWQVFYDLLHRVLQWMQKIDSISPSIKDKTKMCYTCINRVTKKITIIMSPMPQNSSPIIISHCFILFAYISSTNDGQGNRTKIKKVFI